MSISHGDCDWNSVGGSMVALVHTGTANNAGSSQVATFGTSTMVAIFMSDEDLSPHWTQGAGVKSLVSTDGIN
jgi:hypothetical protein